MSSFGRRMSSFGPRLAAIALVGLAARLAYGLLADAPHGIGDDVWYHAVANGIADGRGYSDPFSSVGEGGRMLFGDAGAPLPTAFHPPLFPALLALASLLGATSYDAHQAIGCALGAGTVAVTGLAARRLGGQRLGMVAAAIAAIYPPLVANDSLLMSESLYGLTVGLAVLAALAYSEAPGVKPAAALGLALGAASLTRAEALLFLPLLAAPLMLRGGRRWAHLGVTCIVVALCVAPWAVRNSVTFDEPVLVTTVEGSVVGGANLKSTYYGNMLGAWDFKGLYASPAARDPTRDEAVQSRRWHDEAVRYARDHASRLPLIAALRLMRTWSLYPLDPRDKVDFAVAHYNHIRALEWLSLLMFLAVVCLALAGWPVLRRGGAALVPLAAPLVVVGIVSVLAYGDLRFRQAAEVPLVILAAAGVHRLRPAAGA